MSKQGFAVEIAAAARAVARLELRIRQTRRHLENQVQLLADARNHLRRLAEATEPFEPPAPLTDADRELDAEGPR